MRRILSAWLPAVLYMGILFFVSAQSTLPQVPGAFGFDKLQHFLAYGVLGLLLLRAVQMSKGWTLKTYGLALFFASLYGVSDEIHQKFVPGRSADPLDWMSDTLGAAIALMIFFLIRDYLSKKR